MPELPEVHTTVEGLKKTVVGKTITDVWSDFHVGTARGESETLKNKNYFEKFRKTISGTKIKSVERRGKNILLNLNNNFTIIIHMKMTGHLMVKNYEKENKFIHLNFTFSDGQNLVLSDMRKFASVTISKTGELHLHDTIGKLGVDPFNKKLDSKKFFELLMKRKKWPIKSALLDQTLISGIGNIYSDEILWQTSIHPLSKPTKIPKQKFLEIFKSMRTILKFSIRHGGDSKSDYRNIFGEKGGFQDFHKVYNRKNQKCPKPKCGGIIQRIVIKGRSAHFCPKHQKIYG